MVMPYGLNRHIVAGPASAQDGEEVAFAGTTGKAVKGGGATAGSKVYHAFVAQAGSGAPSPIVIGANDIGAIVWARSTDGTFMMTLTGAFVQNKTFPRVELIAYAVGAEFKADITWTSANVLTMQVRDNGGTLTDGFNAWVEIIVTL